MNFKKISLITLFITYTMLSYSQSDNIVRITNTQILTPEIINFGTIEKEKFVKVLIRNERNNSINIENIIIPQGFSISLKKKALPPKSQVPAYIGFNPNSIQDTGIIKKTIVIETNLIVPIKLNVQAKVNKKD